MTELKQTVTKTQDEGIDSTGAQVEQKSKRIETEVTPDSKSVIGNIVWYVLGAAEILLAARFILKILGANPGSGFVDFVYSVTGILTAPFDNIFGVSMTVAGDIQSVFEPSILVAMAVYAVVAWGLVKLLNVNRPKP
jgi:hypothetical protein